MAVSWLLIAPESPVETSSTFLKAFFASIQIFAAFVVLVFGQWSAIGLGISFLFRLTRKRDVA